MQLFAVSTLVSYFYWFEAVLAMQIDKLLTTDSADGLTSYIIWNIWRSLGYFYPPNVSLMIDVTVILQLNQDTWVLFLPWCVCFLFYC